MGVTLAALVTLLGVATLVWSLVTGAGARTTGSTLSSVDPLVQPAAIAFRQAERASRVPVVDPFVQPAAIEFRRAERGYGLRAADPFVQPAAIEFRRDEREQ